MLLFFNVSVHWFLKKKLLQRFNPFFNHARESLLRFRNAVQINGVKKPETTEKCIPIDQYFEFHQASRCLRNSTTVPIINKPLAPTNLLASSFFYRCIDCWNSLPPSITSSSSINAFRNALSNVDLSRFLKGSIFNYV
jgi:hypothetical protein